MTKLYKINPEHFTTPAIEEAADILRNGGTVAFPTETVYGLGANAMSSQAVEKIFIAKGRPSDNPLIVHIADLDGIYPLINNFPERAKILAEHFWPGPLTMVLPASQDVPSIVTAGLATIAVRMPNHPLALALIREAGVPLAAPSANISGQPSPTTATHVIKDLHGKIDAIIDGGNAEVGVESTVIDLTEQIPVILRPGSVTREMLEAVLGEVKLDQAINANDNPRSPGMKYQHYSPDGEVYLVMEHDKKLARKLEIILDINLRHELRTAFLITKTSAAFLKTEPHLLFTFENVEDAARNLYHALRLCDEQGIDKIYCERYAKKEIGLAVMNRLMKASGGKII